MPFDTEMIDIADLREHKRNYQKHPDDQIDHIVESIRANGIYRNIVIARDNTILAGHGVVKAASRMGMTEVPVVRVDIDPLDIRALKILAGDNEISNLADIDDRQLISILKDVHDSPDVDLLGTGYDEMMLANLLFVTRDENEIADFDEAAEWVGMPEYEPAVEPIKMIVNFENKEDRMAFAKKLGIPITEKTKSIWYPYKPKDDVSSVRFEDE